MRDMPPDPCYSPLNPDSIRINPDGTLVIEDTLITTSSPGLVIVPGDYPVLIKDCLIVGAQGLSNRSPTH